MQISKLNEAIKATLGRNKGELEDEHRQLHTAWAEVELHLMPTTANREKLK